MRYETPTMPRYNTDKREELHTGFGKICWNLNPIDYNSVHTIMKAYLWRPPKKEMTDVYIVIQSLEKVYLFSLDRDNSENSKYDLTDGGIIAPVPFIFYK